MSRISSHVLDTTRGVPASGIHIQLFKLINAQWVALQQDTTNSDGRVANLLPENTPLETGRYKIRFALESYFQAQQQPCFYPQVDIECHLKSEDEHYHIPLLISPFGYSTYRGS